MPHQQPILLCLPFISDPQDDIPFAEALYNNDAFTQSLYNALTDDGIVVMQLGVTPDLEDTADQYSKSKNRAKLTNGLSIIGFDSLHAYEEVNACFNFCHFNILCNSLKFNLASPRSSHTTIVALRFQ